MGKSYPPKSRVEYRDNSDMLRPRNALPTEPGKLSWPSKHLGKPTNAKAEQFRKDLNQSFQPSGVNGHVSKSLNTVVHIYRLWVIEQKTGQWVAEANMPAFEVV